MNKDADMYNTFVIFYTANYCQKIKSFFDVDDLIRSGIKVEFWDLSEITAHEHLMPVFSDGLVEVKISSYAELKKNIKRVGTKGCLYMSFVNYAPYSYRVYSFLSSFNCDILYATNGVLPEISQDSVKRKSIIARYSILEIVKIIFLRCLKKTPLIKPAKFVLISCQKATCDYKVSDETKFVSCNSGDYNRNRRENAEQGDAQVVFIDQYVPFHRDYEIRGIRHIPAAEYFSSLNRFFDKVEEQYNCKVVICAHPSASKYKEHNYFNGRKVVFDDTSKHVKQSIGVISQSSTAVSFPVMDLKPIMLITMESLINSDPEDAAFETLLSRLLKVPMINIDKSEDHSFRGIDMESYTNYLNDYLTTPKAKYLFNSQVLLSIAEDNYQHLLIY